MRRRRKELNKWSKINILQRITEDFVEEWLMKRRWENLASQESDHAGE
jgi:hypothetical protein